MSTKSHVSHALTGFLLSLLTVLALLTVMLCGLFVLATTEPFAESVLSAASEQSQQRIDASAAAIQAEYALTDDTMTLLDNAASSYTRTLAACWHDCWRINGMLSEGAPDPLDSQETLTLVMADTGFQSTVEKALWRSTARDQVVYAFNKLIRLSVFPLRTSISELVTGIAGQMLDLPAIFHAAALTGIICLLLSSLLMLFRCVRQHLSSILLASGIGAVLLSTPMLLLNLPDMLSQLSAIALVQGQRMLLQLGLVWYGVSFMLILLSILLMRRKRHD